jgi:hypothetical protein
LKAIVSPPPVHAQPFALFTSNRPADDAGAVAAMPQSAIHKRQTLNTVSSLWLRWPEFKLKKE